MYIYFNCTVLNRLFLIVYICKLQQPNIRDICVLYHMFRIVGHRLKSGMNEVINMLGYNVTQSLWYRICLSEEANVFLYSTITNQWNENN